MSCGKAKDKVQIPEPQSSLVSVVTKLKILKTFRKPQSRTTAFTCPQRVCPGVMSSRYFGLGSGRFVVRPNSRIEFVLKSLSPSMMTPDSSPRPSRIVTWILNRIESGQTGKELRAATK
jgi:hypothetical protein